MSERGPGYREQGSLEAEIASIPQNLAPAHRQQIEETYRLREELRELRETKASPAAKERALYKELHEYTELLRERLLMYLPVLVEYQDREIKRLRGEPHERGADQGGYHHAGERSDGEDRGGGLRE